MFDTAGKDALHWAAARWSARRVDNRMKNRLRELRGARHWSQADLAAELGVSRQTVNAIETERYDPSLPLAFKIARLFDRALEDVFQDEG
jgi:putative transcriptional regulator